MGICWASASVTFTYSFRSSTTLRIRRVIKAERGTPLAPYTCIYITYIDMYIQIIYLNLSYSFRQLFYAPISLGRKFYFNASESQITHNVGASQTHTHTHLLRQTHTHSHYLTISHSHTHSTVDRVRAHSEHVPFILP